MQKIREKFWWDAFFRAFVDVTAQDDAEDKLSDLPCTVTSPIESIICVEEDAKTILDEKKVDGDKENKTKKIDAPKVLSFH